MKFNNCPVPLRSASPSHDYIAPLTSTAIIIPFVTDTFKYLRKMRCDLCITLVLALVLGSWGESEMMRSFKEQIDEFKYDANDSSEEADVNKIAASFTKYCPINLEELKNNSYDVADCIDKLNYNLTVCTLIRTSVPQCFTPITSLFTNCLKGEGSTLPKFLVDVTITINSYFCSSRGEELMELANICIFDDSDELDQFTEKVMESFSKFTNVDELPSRDYICSTLIPNKQSILDHIRKVCFNEVTRKFFTGFVEAFFSTCQSENEVVRD